MTHDELIRILATMRTNLNADRLALLAVPGQMNHDFLTKHSEEIELHQGLARDGLGLAVEQLNILIALLNRYEKQKPA